ncbi:MAG: RecX family transcriptional regulator [Firmicutes bacterium]|nr:RecX family transcriptional regulator [Bacillota bacterium]
MRITSTVKDEREERVYKIYIDNVYSFSVSEEDYFRFNLYEKYEISEEEINNIKEAANFTAAKSKALIYLSFKFRTEKEVRLKLEGEGFSSGITEKVINDLKAEGYINDRLYVMKYLHERRKLNPKSKRRLIQELKNKGIKKELILEGLEELKIDNILVAEELVRKKFNNLNLSQKRVEKKVYQYLQYRGFSADEIKTVLSKLAHN